MSRKDYVLIASVLRRSWDATDAGSDERTTVGSVIMAMGRALEDDNPRFNYHRFCLAATGVADLPSGEE